MANTFQNLQALFLTVSSGCILYYLGVDISPLSSFIFVLRGALVAKLVILDISFLTSFILASKVVLVVKLVVSGISSIFFNNILTTSRSLFKSAERGTNLSTSNLSTLIFKLHKLFGTIFHLSISNLSTLDFKIAKSLFF